MTQEEKQIVLKECNDKLEEIDFQRTKNEEYWEQYYNKHYRKMFLVEDILDRVLHSGFTGLVVVGSGMALYNTGHSVALSVGVPVGGYIAVGLTDLIITFKSVHKKKDYWGQLRHHTEVQDQLEFSKYPYRIISGYLKEGDKSLLHQYRIHLEDKDVPEFDYLDVDTTDLSPLMVKALEEMKSRTIELKEELQTSLVVDITTMHTSIMDSLETIPELEAYQKMLKKYVPKEEPATLTSS